MICEKGYLKDIKQELLKRICLPLYLPLLALIASFLILKSKNNHEYSNFIFKLFLTLFIFLIISEVSVRYAGLIDKYNMIFIILYIIILFIFQYYYTVSHD